MVPALFDALAAEAEARLARPASAFARGTDLAPASCVAVAASLARANQKEVDEAKAKQEAEEAAAAAKAKEEADAKASRTAPLGAWSPSVTRKG